MTKAPGLTITTTSEGGWTRVALQGPLNEEAKALLAPLATQIGPRCLFDLADVTYLNSVGIRDWSIFLRTFKEGREIAFDRCADEVVRTMNMVTNFRLQLPVRSLFRAYGCESCGHEQTVPFFEGRDYAQGAMPTPPSLACLQCGKPTAPFVQDEEFFQFLVSDG
jgi:hypothetical protein